MDTTPLLATYSLNRSETKRCTVQKATQLPAVADIKPQSNVSLSLRARPHGLQL